MGQGRCFSRSRIVPLQLSEEYMEQYTQDKIASLAEAEASRVRKFRDQAEEEIDRAEHGLPAVPLLHIEKRGLSGAWSVRSSGSEGHPNEPRMAFVVGWLERTLSTTREGGDPTGTYRLELHDSCTYLPRATEYSNVLSFCRSTLTDTSIATFPDPYQAAGYGAGPTDALAWEFKRPTVVFAGSTTGDPDPSKNVRVLACLWALGQPRETNFRISSVVQMRPYDLLARHPQVRAVMAPHMSPQDQFSHRFIMNIAGNTACWSRVPMVLGSRSVLFHMPHADAAWYYPEMKAGEHFVECADHAQILKNRLTCMADETTCRHMTSAANLFRSQYLTHDAASLYAGQLLANVRGK